MTIFVVFITDTYDDANDDTWRRAGKNVSRSYEDAGIPTHWVQRLLQPVNVTPQYIPTPKANWSSGTPSTTGSRTPGGGKGRQWADGTPGQMGPPSSNRTPQSVSSHVHRRSGGDGTPRHGPSPSGKSAMDWAQAAQMWAKQRQAEDSPASSSSRHTPGGRTPSSRTPGGRTPGRHTPGRYTPGDATPLFDEH